MPYGPIEILGFAGAYLLAAIISMIFCAFALENTKSDALPVLIVSTMTLVLGTLAIIGLGAAPWQEAGKHEYTMLSYYHDNSDQTIMLSKQALADDVLTNLEYHCIRSASEEDSERRQIEDVKTSVHETEYRTYPVERLQRTKTRQETDEQDEPR